MTESQVKPVLVPNHMKFLFGGLSGYVDLPELNQFAKNLILCLHGPIQEPQKKAKFIIASTFPMLSEVQGT